MRYRSKSAHSIHVTSVDFMKRALWGTSGRPNVGSNAATGTSLTVRIVCGRWPLLLSRDSSALTGTSQPFSMRLSFFSSWYRQPGCGSGCRC